MILDLFRRFAGALAVAVLLAAVPAGAVVQPEERLADPALEERARDLSRELRCVVCQNQSIDDSDAGMARDLRRLVRERLAAGDSDAAVLDYVTARYGDFVRLRPPVAAHTALLWAAPLMLLVVGAVAVGAVMRRRGRETAAPDPLTAEERRRVDALLSGPSDGAPGQT